MSFEGVHTPLVTPFKADGEIDYDMLGKHAASLVGRVAAWASAGPRASTMRSASKSA